MVGVSRQNVYQGRQRQLDRDADLLKVKAQVACIRRRMPRIGTRKLYHMLGSYLDQTGIKMGRDALFDFLRGENMLIKPHKRYIQTTNSKHWLRKHPNLLSDLTPSRAEQVFVSDITYIKSLKGVHYLSLVTDAYTRKIMGYELSDNMEAETVGRALDMAAGARFGAQPLIHHSDRGVQYCSSHYQNLLQTHNITPSMTDGYDCYQNALAERINGILKQEFLLYRCQNRNELECLVQESISIYNNERPHSCLKMQTPNEVHKKAEEDQLLRLNYIHPKTVNLF